MRTVREPFTLLPFVTLTALAALSTGCTSQLARASSGQIGCAPSEIAISDHSMGIASATWTATCRDRVFFCSGVQTGENTGQYQCTPAMGSADTHVSRPATPAAAAPPAASAPAVEAEEKPFPKKALGFEFGSAPGIAEQTCTSGGHEWRGSGETFGCSGAGVDVGIPVNTKLSYCGESLCEIRGFATLAAGGAGSQQLAKLRKALVSQYGTPDDEETKIPQECQKTLVNCIVEEKASWGSTWEWDDGALIRARSGTDGKAAVIGILYRRDAEAQQIHEATEELNTDAF